MSGNSLRKEHLMKRSLAMLAVPCCALLLGLGRSAQAVPITYTFSITGSGGYSDPTTGSITNPFTDQTFTFTLKGDTADLSSPGANELLSTVAVSDFSIVGGGSGQTLDPVAVGLGNNGDGTGFLILVDPGIGLSGIQTFAPSGLPPTYALDTNLGAISTQGVISFPLPTTLGGLVFDPSAPLSGTFTSSLSAVPELSSVLGFSSFALLGGLGLLRRKRARQAD